MPFENRYNYTNIIEPSSQKSFRGRPIFSAGQSKQVYPKNNVIKLVDLKLLGQPKIFGGPPVSFVN